MTHTKETEERYKKSIIILRIHNPKSYMKDWISLNGGTFGIMNFFETKENIKQFLIRSGSKRIHADKWASYIESENKKFAKISILKNL